MSSHRKPRLSAARKRARTVTLCAATLGAAALPTLAQAATTGGATAVKTAVPATAAHVVNAADATRTGGDKATFQAVSDSSGSSSSNATYTVVSGDTLSGIAEQKLGNGDDYSELFKLNKDHTESDGRTFTDPNLIYPGWQIELPSGSSSSDSASSDSSSSSSSDSSSGGSSAASSASSTTASNSSDSSSSSSSSTSGSSSSSSTGYADDLDGWIQEAQAILAQNGYTVSYNAIYETAMNESSGDPTAENGWDSNAAAGDPSIGLMQTTQTTFDAYALPGYDDITNPVDNIIAAAIYAQDTYGGLDVVVADRCGGSCWYGY
ncbi:MAG TPA: transglycosylase SLT domain-containing protein [Actinospica sp.]|nr:transglycosylase SLT domain-containing protein [Actinospica sp.]